MQRRRLLIGNEWIEARETLTIRNPHNGEIVGEVAKGGPDELEKAAQAAVGAFEKTRRLSSGRRADLLGRVADGLTRHRDEMAKTITLENAKTLTLSRGEVDRAIATFVTAAEEAKRIGGELLPLDLNASAEGRVGITRRFPLGPILAISPFNFPLNLVAHKVAPSMAAGNSLVLKPSSATPLSALLLGEILLDAGMEPGMVNIVPCSAGDADRIVGDDRFKLVTFTGSPAVGWELKRKAGKKRVCLELGGNAALVVHEDADLDRAAERAVFGAFSFSGQVCISVQRVYLQKKIAEAFTRKFLERTSKLVLGDPMDHKTDLGPMITPEAVKKTQAWVDEAVAGGARLLAGGKSDGRFFPPTVLEGVTDSMKVHCSEVFAPVVNFYTYGDFSEALVAVNDSAYGLQAGVFTRDVARIFQAFDTLEVGGIIVNDAPTWRVDHMPYGGVKDSGLGREGLRYAIEEMTELRLLALNMNL